MRGKHILSDAWASIIFIFVGIFSTVLSMNPIGIFQCAMRHKNDIASTGYEVCTRWVFYREIASWSGLIFILLGFILSIRGFRKDSNKFQRIISLVILTIIITGALIRIGIDTEMVKL